MVDTQQPERRKHKRVPFIKEVYVRDIGLLRCLEISIGGMFLETIIFYPVGTALDLQFKIYETDADPINVQAGVLYNHKDIGLGLAFLNLKSEDREKIETFIAQAE